MGHKPGLLGLNLGYCQVHDDTHDYAKPDIGKVKGGVTDNGTANRTSMTAAMHRLRFLVKSTWFSTSVLRPTEAIMPYSTMHAPPSTQLGTDCMTPMAFPKKLTTMATMAATRREAGL